MVTRNIMLHQVHRYNAIWIQQWLLCFFFSSPVLNKILSVGQLHNLKLMDPNTKPIRGSSPIILVSYVAKDPGDIA